MSPALQRSWTANALCIRTLRQVGNSLPIAHCPLSIAHCPTRMLCLNTLCPFTCAHTYTTSPHTCAHLCVHTPHHHMRPPLCHRLLCFIYLPCNAYAMALSCEGTSLVSSGMHSRFLRMYDSMTRYAQVLTGICNLHYIYVGPIYNHNH
jgi:hypothetical protein